MKFGKVLVTGGAGFLGSQLVKRLHSSAEHIFIIDDCSTGNRNELPLSSEKITFYEESIRNKDVLEEVLPQVEWVFHLACQNLVLSVEDLQRDLETNLLAGFELLQKTKACCPQLKRFIYTSTAS